MDPRLMKIFLKNQLLFRSECEEVWKAFLPGSCEGRWRDRRSGIPRDRDTGWEERELGMEKTMLPKPKAESGFSCERTRLQEWEA